MDPTSKRKHIIYPYSLKENEEIKESETLFTIQLSILTIPKYLKALQFVCLFCKIYENIQRLGGQVPENADLGN